MHKSLNKQQAFTPLSWEISKKEIQEHLKLTTGSDKVPDRIIISLEDLLTNKYGLHDPNYVLILSQEAANFLIGSEDLKTTMKYIHLVGGSVEEFSNKLSIYDASNEGISINFG